MTYLLDTNAWISLLNRHDSPVAGHLKQVEESTVAMCSVVKTELYYGAMKSTRVEANLDLLGRLFERFSCLPFDDAAAEACARIRADLSRRGSPIGPYDCMIAATALSHELTLVTHNVAEFRRVDGLRIEDWES